MRKILCVAVMALLYSYTNTAKAQSLPNTIEAESYSETNSASKTKGDQGTVVNKFSKGAWIKFNEVDFGKGITKLKFRASSGATVGKLLLEVRLDAADGKLLGTLTVEKNGWGSFKEQELEIKKTKGKQTVVLVATDGALMLNWFELVQ